MSQHVLEKCAKRRNSNYAIFCVVLQSFRVSNLFSEIAAMFFSFSTSNGVLFILFNNCVGFSEAGIKPMSLFV